MRLCGMEAEMDEWEDMIRPTDPIAPCIRPTYLSLPMDSRRLLPKIHKNGQPREKKKSSVSRIWPDDGILSSLLVFVECARWPSDGAGVRNGR